MHVSIRGIASESRSVRAMRFQGSVLDCRVLSLSCAKTIGAAYSVCAGPTGPVWPFCRYRFPETLSSSELHDMEPSRRLLRCIKTFQTVICDVHRKNVAVQNVLKFRHHIYEKVTKM